MIKKNKFLFLLLFGLFLFIPKNAFAKSCQVDSANSWSVWTDSTNEVSASGSAIMKSATYNGEHFFVHNLGTGPFYRLSFGIPRIPVPYQDFSYDVSFKIVVPNMKNVSINNYVAEGVPIVSLNDKICQVYPLNSFVSSGVTSSSLFGVNCNNISFSSNNMSVNFYTPGTPTDLSFNYNQYGYSDYWDFTETNSKSDVGISIDKNTDEVKKQTEATKEQTETIKDKDTSESQEQASGFFDDFSNDDFGLSDIITMPLTFIQGLSSSTCYSLNLPLPFVDTNATLPCMTSIYQQYFGSFLTLYQTITTGIIAYWCCINIFRMVQGFKNPDSDEIEVMDL